MDLYPFALENKENCMSSSVSPSSVALSLAPTPSINPVLRENVQKAINELSPSRADLIPIWQNPQWLEDFLQKPYLSLLLHRETDFSFFENPQVLIEIRDQVAGFRSVMDKRGCLDSKCSYNAQGALSILWIVVIVCLFFIPFEKLAGEDNTDMVATMAIVRIAIGIGTAVLPALKRLAELKKKAAEEEVPPRVHRIAVIVNDEARPRLRNLMKQLNHDWAQAYPLTRRPNLREHFRISNLGDNFGAQLLQGKAFGALLNKLIGRFNHQHAQEAIRALLPETPSHVFDAPRVAQLLLQDVREGLDGIKHVEGVPPSTEMFGHLIRCRDLIDGGWMNKYEAQELARVKKLYGDRDDGKAPQLPVRRLSTLSPARLDSDRRGSGQPNGHVKKRS